MNDREIQQIALEAAARIAAGYATHDSAANAAEVAYEIAQAMRRAIGESPRYYGYYAVDFNDSALSTIGMQRLIAQMHLATAQGRSMAHLLLKNVGMASVPAIIEVTHPLELQGRLCPVEEAE